MFNSLNRRWGVGLAVLTLWLGMGTTRSSFADTPKVPEGFSIRLVAAVPAVQYPCQVATAPDGSLFVAEDPMDQIGPVREPIDRILLFRDGQDPVVFADTLNAVFGMVWHEGALYVMHMPYLSIFRDTDGDGKADKREDLFTDLGVPAGSPNDLNDHIVSGLKIGIDNMLYISVGDKGIPKATGRDGRTVQVKGGGIVRCRLDGTGIEVFSTGTRNHLEANLDASDNLFTYDNTDDGLGWWTRVTHHIDGGYYGYPYDYHDRTDRMLPRMAEYGGGSPCGGIAYNEDVWPEKYRGRIYWSEWGKATVPSFRFEPNGASFKIGDVFDFVERGKVENFRPLDLALSWDGKTLYIADWSMGGWNNKTEKLGRVYAVTYDGADQVKTRPRLKDSDPLPAQFGQLDHPSFNERFRAQTAIIKAGQAALPAAVAALADPNTSALAKRHLVWIIDGIAGGNPRATLPLIDALKSPIAEVRAQAARAIGERGATVAGEALRELLKDAEPTVRLQAIIALGRIGDPTATADLIPHVAENDVYLAHAARKALDRIGDWEGIARGLSLPDAKVRQGLLLTLERVYETEAAAALNAFATSPGHSADERATAIRYLAAVFRKAPDWDGKWWGTQPARNKAPARTLDWKGTPLVLESLRKLLGDPLPAIRIAAIESAIETNDPAAIQEIRGKFSGEADEQVRRAIAHTLGVLKDKDSLPLMAAALRDSSTPPAVREAALEAVESIGTGDAVTVLLDVMKNGGLSDGRTRGLIAALGRFKDAAAVKPLIDTLNSASPAIRASIIDAVASILTDKANDEHGVAVAAIRSRIDDASADVKKHAIQALGKLGDRASIPALIKATGAEETRFESAMALAAMPDLTALPIYLRGLEDKSTELRGASSKAIGDLRDLAAPVLDDLAKQNQLPASTVPLLREIYQQVEPIRSWKTLGPFPLDAPPNVSTDQPIDFDAKIELANDKKIGWRTLRFRDPRGQVNLGRIYSQDDKLAAFGYAEIDSKTDHVAKFAVGSDDTLTVWVNGKQVYDFTDSRAFDYEQSTFEAPLVQGVNRILILCGNNGGPWQYAVAVSPVADYAFLKGPGAAAGAFDLARYTQEAGKGKGNPAHGKTLFFDLKGLACIKCHLVGKEGGAVGPELSSVGAKYPRDELIAAVLTPSAKISQGYETFVFALNDGRVLTGIIKNETPDAVEIQDNDAKLIRISKDEIEDRKKSEISIMPDGLAQGITASDFADLIGYLETLRNETPAASPATP